MSLFKLFVGQCSKLIHLKSLSRDVQIKVFPAPISVNALSERGIRKAYPTFLRVMKKRRKLAGPERLRHRSEYDNWDYKTELYCFPKRLSEEISEETLRVAFMHKSFVDREEIRRKEMGLTNEDVEVKLTDQNELARLGDQIMSPFIKAWLRHNFPALPEEGIIAMHDFVTTEDVLAHISTHIGTKDLIMCTDFPCEKSTLANTFKAVVGAIATDANRKRAEIFVLDFVLTQLLGTDVLELWDIPNPMAVLDSLLERHGRATSEYRLAFESGRNTLEAIYLVAVFSDKKYLGKGPGETVAIAQEMAAYDALRQLFKIRLDKQPLPFEVKEWDFDMEAKHPTLSEWYSDSFQKK